MSSKCKFHDQVRCKWCRKWRKTFKYFRDRKCTELRLYCVKLVHYRTGEAFYKIGLTADTVARRFDKEMERFSLDILNEQTLPIYEAVTKETDLLYKFSTQGRSYVPKARISGYTECFR